MKINFFDKTAIFRNMFPLRSRNKSWICHWNGWFMVLPNRKKSKLCPKEQHYLLLNWLMAPCVEWVLLILPREALVLSFYLWLKLSVDYMFCLSYRLEMACPSINFKKCLFQEKWCIDQHLNGSQSDLVFNLLPAKTN